MDCICLRRKHRKKRQQSKFRPMSPPVTPGHSQPSSLGHNPDVRLPKVNSTGLWMGASGMYSGGPTPAYYISRSVPVSAKYSGDPRLVPSASSETRIPPSGYPNVPPRPFYGSQCDLLLMPSQGGQRIFHSQQLTPLFEVPFRNGAMDIYDVYQFGDGSKSKLAESKHTRSYYEDGFRLAPKLERSKSDIGEKSKHARRSSEKSRQPSHHSRSSSNEGKRHRSSSKKNNRNSSEYGKGSRGSRSADSFKGGQAVSREVSQKSGSSGQNNRAFSADADMSRVSSIKEDILLKPSMISAGMKPPIPTFSVVTVAVVSDSPPLMNGTPGVVSAIVDNRSNIYPSATDSMKLLAKNKTDDQKTIVPQTGDLVSDKDLEKNTLDGYHHYIYHGDIYAVTNNRKPMDEEEENPIISRMKDMVIEKSRNSNPSSPRGSQETPDIVMQGTSSDISQYNQGPIYEEIKIEKFQRVTKETTVTNEDKDSEKPKITKLANPADLSILDGIELPPASDLGSYEALDKSYSEDNHITNRVNSVETGESSQPTSPIAIMRVKKTSLKGNDDVDGANEEMSKAGKQITDSAFEFLNTYLSDDEGGDAQIDSPPLSPSS